MAQSCSIRGEHMDEGSSGMYKCSSLIETNTGHNSSRGFLEKKSSVKEESRASLMMQTYLDNPRELVKRLTVSDWEEMSDEDYSRFVSVLDCNGISFDWFAVLECYLAWKRRFARRTRDFSERLSKVFKDTNLIEVMRRQGRNNCEGKALDGEEMSGLPPYTRQAVDQSKNNKRSKESL